jgi:hypothetical protein
LGWYSVLEQTKCIAKRRAAPVSLVVLDQISVPENEKLNTHTLSTEALEHEIVTIGNGVSVDGDTPNVESTPRSAR